MGVQVFHKNLPIDKDIRLFFFSILSISNLLMPNSKVKCLKSLSFKYEARVSSEPLQNFSESIKVIDLLTIMLVYLSMPLGITSISTLKLFNSFKIMCPSCICKL